LRFKEVFMKFVWRLLALGALFCLYAGPASAQYVYLDTNGDGVHSSGDQLQPNGTPTTINAYINTNHNRDGSLATCDTGDGDLGMWNSYAVNLKAAGGTVTFSNFVNQQASFGITCVGVGVDFLAAGDEMTACRATATSEAGGLKQMFTVTVTGQSGTPSIQVIPLGTLGPNFTSFGTPCSAHEFDNTYKLGDDFFDSDGAAPAPGGNATPVLSAPVTVTAAEGEAVTITVTATDTDLSDVLTITATGAPSSLTLNTTPASGTATATFTGTLGLNDQGNHTITWTVSDGTNPPQTATTMLTVANLDQPPIVTAPATVSAVVGSPFTLEVTVTEPDGDIITSFTAEPVPVGATFTTNSGRNSGTLEWTPVAGQEGGYDVTFTAMANGAFDAAATHITVVSGGADVPPSVTAPAVQTGSEGAPLIFIVSATDANGDAITSLMGSPLPEGATFTANAANTEGTFTWTPTSSQSGTYNVTWTAANSLSGTAATAITIADVDHPPVLDAIGDVTVGEGGTLTVNLHATDQDNDLITLTGTIPDFATLNAPTSGTGEVSTTISLAPTAGATGTYTVTVTATANGQTSTQTFAIVVTGAEDTAPFVNAPATISGTTGTEVTFTVTASDANGDVITLFAASPLPVGSTFNTNAANTSGTFTWTPSATQAGTFDVTFTASNLASGSATTHITIEGAGVDVAPVVTVTPSISGTVGTELNFTVTATDANGDAITSLTASPLPSGATFNTNASNTSGTFTWTPSASQTGTFDVTFTASNALSGSATAHLAIEAAAEDQAPVVTTPPTVNGTEGAELSFVVTAFDADGDAIASLMAAPLPTGATFDTNAAHTSGTFTWTPSGTQAGTYDVTFTAANALSGSAATHITIGEGGTGGDHPPIVCAPRCVTSRVGRTISFKVTASDADGDAISSLTASTLPTGATFTTNTANTSGTFRWSPIAGQEGTYDITFTGENALSGHWVTHIKIREADQSVVLAEIADVTVAEGATITVPVLATDADNDTIRLTACLPAFATLNQPRLGVGTVSTMVTIAPQAGDAGTYNVFVRARGKTGDCEIERFKITVTPAAGGNTPPTISADATATVNEGVSLTVNVTASDANGDNLALSASGVPTGASFTDNHDNTATLTWTPDATQSGTYTVTLAADDHHGGTTTSTLVITVNDVAGAVQALVFTEGSNNTTHLGDEWCVNVEPVDASFATGDVILSSITLSYGGHTVTAASTEARIDVDSNHNDVSEVQACFSADQLAELFGSLGVGQTTVNVTVGGTLAGGGTFMGTLDQKVVVPGATARGHGVMQVVAKPNPLNPTTSLDFRTSRPGQVRVDLFDSRGRLVRSLVAQSLAAGLHSVPWNGTDDRGTRVASGAYFFRIQAPDGRQVQRVTVVK
jgi:Big-like domain-containing protein/flagellar hook capping protein FlgD/putative Ig domain-containing protein